MEENKIAEFMAGFAAATQLLKRAGDNGYLFEYVCLATAVIDAALRIGLILKNQLKTKSKDIINQLIFQKDEDKIVFEREIYKRALKEGIITKNLFDKLEALYIKRNKIIHRYIISELTTKEVLEIGIEYGRIIPEISDRIEELEDKQIELGIGMTIRHLDAARARLGPDFEEMCARKHQSPILTCAFKKDTQSIFDEFEAQGRHKSQ
jgi:uncharacterized protein YutE (UPF0331/DUF86 family)